MGMGFLRYLKSLRGHGSGEKRPFWRLSRGGFPKCL
jgi:hypothetical protein